MGLNKCGGKVAVDSGRVSMDLLTYPTGLVLAPPPSAAERDRQLGKILMYVRIELSGRCDKRLRHGLVEQRRRARAPHPVTYLLT